MTADDRRKPVENARVHKIIGGNSVGRQIPILRVRVRYDLGRASRPFGPLVLPPVATVRVIFAPPCVIGLQDDWVHTVVYRTAHTDNTDYRRWESYPRLKCILLTRNRSGQTQNRWRERFYYKNLRVRFEGRTEFLTELFVSLH